jgi:hypothetical protein
MTPPPQIGSEKHLSHKGGNTTPTKSDRTRFSRSWSTGVYSMLPSTPFSTARMRSSCPPSTANYITPLFSPPSTSFSTFQMASPSTGISPLSPPLSSSTPSRLSDRPKPSVLAEIGRSSGNSTTTSQSKALKGELTETVLELLKVIKKFAVLRPPGPPQRCLAPSGVLRLLPLGNSSIDRF